MKLIGQVRGIRALCEVAETGSFSSAADALGMTQSAVSQQVAALERAVGLVLLQRGVRPAELTEAGRALVRHGKAINARLDAAEHELAETGQKHAGRLRLGSFPTALATFVPSALARLRRERPAVVLTVVDDHMQGLLPRLVDATLDLAVVFDHAPVPQAGSDRIQRQHLFDDAYQAVLPAGHRLARGRRALHVADLSEEAWIGGRPGSTWFHIVRSACQAAGFEPQASLFSDDYRAVQAFVAAGLGVAVIPGLAVVNPVPGVEVRRLAGGVPVRRISLAHAEEAIQAPAAKAMASILRDVTSSLRSADPSPARPQA